MKTRQCNICKKEYQYTGNKSMYCSRKCNDRAFYLDHKEEIIKRSRDWEQANPKRRKIISTKANKKFREKHPERFKKLMQKYYHKSKAQRRSRRLSKDNAEYWEKVCNNCSATRDLIVHHEVYPITDEEVRKAYKQKKIYFLCLDCSEILIKNKRNLSKRKIYKL